MNPPYLQGYMPNYPPGNPAQQNQTFLTGMGNAAPPFSGSAAPPFLGNAAQYYQGYAAPPPSWATATRAMQPGGTSTAASGPIPSCDPAHPPKLDDSVTCLIPKAAKSNDRFLSKLQQFCMDGMGPLIFLYEQFQKNEQPDSDTLKAAVKCSLSLMASASSHFSLERRKCIMKHINNDLKHLAEAQYPEMGSFLLGEGFGTRAKATADIIKALKGVQFQKRFSGSGNSKYKPQSRRQQWGVSSPNFQRSVFNHQHFCCPPLCPSSTI